MKMTPVNEVPDSKRGKKKLQAMLDEFMNSGADVVRLNISSEDYSNLAVARSCIAIAVVRSGYPIKVFKRSDDIYLCRDV